MWRACRLLVLEPCPCALRNRCSDKHHFSPSLQDTPAFWHSLYRHARPPLSTVMTKPGCDKLANSIQEDLRAWTNAQVIWDVAPRCNLRQLDLNRLICTHAQPTCLLAVESRLALVYRGHSRTARCILMLARFAVGSVGTHFQSPP